jgi:hypothetical protein
MLWFCRSTLSAEDEVEVLKGLPEREIEERVHARKARLSACISAKLFLDLPLNPQF